MKSSDISDVEFLALIDTLQDEFCGREDRAGWVFTWDIEKVKPEWPYKVFQAKARSLIKRGLLDGCACGCRGDYEITGEGLKVIKK